MPIAPNQSLPLFPPKLVQQPLGVPGFVKDRLTELCPGLALVPGLPQHAQSPKPLWAPNSINLQCSPEVKSPFSHVSGAAGGSANRQGPHATGARLGRGTEPRGPPGLLRHIWPDHSTGPTPLQAEHIESATGIRSHCRMLAEAESHHGKLAGWGL